MFTQITGVILAGGHSRRMGKDKRLIRLGEHTLFDRVRLTLEQLFEEVLIVVAQADDSLIYHPPLHARIVIDRIPSCGSAGGLYTGLYYASAPRVFAVACDMPFLNRELIAYMVQCKETADIVMAHLKTGLQPMHAVYSKRCLTPLERMLNARQLRIQDLLTSENLVVHYIEEPALKAIDPALLSFLNVNTPADVEFAAKLLPTR